MFKILATENKTDHNGKLFSGFVNVDGSDLEFDTFESAVFFLVEHSDFASEFNFLQIVAA
jgi:hypothetical protein